MIPKVKNMQIIPWENEQDQLGVAFEYDNRQRSMYRVPHHEACFFVGRIASLEADNAALKSELAELREAAAWYLECKTATLPFLSQYMNLEKWDHAQPTRTIVEMDRERCKEWDATQLNAERALRALLNKQEKENL